MKEKKIIIVLVIISIILILVGIVMSFSNEKGTKTVEEEVQPNSLATMTSIESQTVVDNKLAKIDFLSLNIDDFNIQYELKYKIKNKTSQEIAVYVFGRTANDICIYQTLDNTIGVKANEEYESILYIPVSELEREKIENIGYMTFDIITELYPNNDVKEVQNVQIKTSIYDKVKQNYNFGDVVFSDDKIDVQFIEFGKSESGVDLVRLFFYNKSNAEVNLWLKDKLNINVDGKDYYSTFNVTIPSMKYALSEIAFHEFDGRIEDIEKIRIGFSYFETEKYTITSTTKDFDIYPKKNKSEDSK